MRIRHTQIATNYTIMQSIILVGISIIILIRIIYAKHYYVLTV